MSLHPFDALSGIPETAPRPGAPLPCPTYLGRRGRFSVLCGRPAVVVGRDLAAVCEAHAMALLGRHWREVAVPEGGFYYLPSYFEWLRLPAPERDGAA